MSNATELLRRALEALKDAKEEISDWGAYADHYFQEKWDYKGSITQYDPLIENIRTFLAAEPEAEPVTDEILEQHIENSDGRWVDGEFRIDGPDLMNLLRAVSRPEQLRKPMTDKEIDKGIDTNACSDEEVYFFAAGVRFAEKHHDISGEDQ